MVPVDRPRGLINEALRWRNILSRGVTLLGSRNKADFSSWCALIAFANSFDASDFSFSPFARCRRLGSARKSSLEPSKDSILVLRRFALDLVNKFASEFRLLDFFVIEVSKSSLKRLTLLDLLFSLRLLVLGFSGIEPLSATVSAQNWKIGVRSL